MMIKKIAPRANDELAEVEEIFDHEDEVDQADAGNDDDDDYNRTIKYCGAVGIHLLAKVGLTNTDAYSPKSEKRITRKVHNIMCIMLWCSC